MNIYSEIIKKIQTQESAEIIIEAIDILRDNLYRLKNVEENELSNLPQDETLELLRTMISSVKTKKAEWLTGLREEIKKMRPLWLDVAVRLDLNSRKEIFSWVKENVGEDVVTRFGLDPGVMAGVRVTFEGKYYEKGI